MTQHEAATRDLDKKPGFVFPKISLVAAAAAALALTGGMFLTGPQPSADPAVVLQSVSAPLDSNQLSMAEDYCDSDDDGWDDDDHDGWDDDSDDWDDDWDDCDD